VRTCSLAWGMCLILTAALMGQSAAPAQFRARTDIVEVYATVKLKTGTAALDMTKDDFELREDGQVREIAVFSRSLQPLSVAMVLDRSGSTFSQFAKVLMAAREFVALQLPGDRSAISTLSWDCQPFTGDAQALLTVLQMDFPGDFGSPIWAAVDRSMSSLQSESGRRVVLLLSDGADNQQDGLFTYGPAGIRASAFGWRSPCQSADTLQVHEAKDVLLRAEREAVMVYVVSVGSGTADLSRLSKETGGSHQALADYGQMQAAFRSIADELHLQYLLGFVPSFRDGKLHHIELRAKRSGVAVRARTGYVAIPR
jgi:Ca-activated chloride channel family protein